MTPVLEAIAQHPELSLVVYVAGEHLSEAHGHTHREVAKLFPNAKVLDARIAGDTHEHHARFTSRLHHELTEALVAERPDALLLLGDRPEMLTGALTATYLRIPIVHLHGGDLSTSVDNAVRFAISRLAHLHLPATDAAAKRLLSSGEHPSRVQAVGAPAIDRIMHTPFPTRAELFFRLDLDASSEVVLVTQHPATESVDVAEREMQTVLIAVERFKKMVVVIHPHLDPGGSRMLSIIKTYAHRPEFRLIPSLSFIDFLALARESVAWVGNSSAGVIESASLKIPVVNVGSRQDGRERGENVVDVPIDADAIFDALHFVTSDPVFRAKLTELVSPWGDGRTGPRVADILAQADFVDLVHKRFAFPV